MEETLRSLGLEIFIDVENKIDDEAFLLLGDSELKELIPQIGPRIKIKNYISNFKQQQQQKANVHPSISELQDPVETLSSTPCESDIVFEYDNPLMPTIQEEADYSTHTVQYIIEPASGIVPDRDINERRIFHYVLDQKRNRQEHQVLVLNDEKSVKYSNFDPKKQTIIIAHGWLSNGRSEPNPTLRDVYLTKLDVNIITVDWRAAARKSYIGSVLSVPSVGRTLGRFINWLADEFGLKHQNVHLIGFSLGAHLVGIAGRETGGKIARVTGLDPAGPLWSYNANKLASSDGVYVEAIHTDGGVTAGGLGIGADCAHVDFYPNGGVSQPGCITNVCNHNRAWQFFAATVTFDHLVGRRCSNGLQITFNTCRGENLNLGNDNLRKTGTSGAYRVNTARRFPY